ncbi:MAG: hypothetical protein IPF50_11835 [Proteobacteria bacterium]|nr:hypothetical protein [Pseudomonadota bacterium]
MSKLHLVATVAIIGVVLFAQVPGEEPWAAELTNFGHGSAFAVLTVLLFRILRAQPTWKLPILAEYAVVVVIALALGAVIELLQGMIGRDQSIDDLARRPGTLAAAGFLAMVDPKLQGRGSHRGMRLAGLLLGLAGTTCCCGSPSSRASPTWIAIAAFRRWPTSAGRPACIS